MSSNKNKLILLILLLPPTLLFSKNNTINFSEYEKNINKQIAEISAIRFDEQKADSLSQLLVSYFHKTLHKANSFSYPFDSLQGIGKVESKNLRIFTWNIIKNDGTYTYYGLIQHLNKQTKQVNVFILHDKSEEIEDVEKATLSDKKWYGALYYDIVKTQMPDKSTLYTLMGWDGNNLHTSKKIIETLYFTKSGKPKFGKSVFRLDRIKQKRIIFEFSQMANMMVAYKKDLKMIVYDHLSPIANKYENNPEFYGPDYSFDGLKFQYGVWKHLSDIPYKGTPKKKRRKK